LPWLYHVGRMVYNEGLARRIVLRRGLRVICRQEELVRAFSGICIITHDVRRLRDFYRDVLQVQTEGEGDFVSLATRGAKLSLYTEEGMEQMASCSTKAAGRGSCVLEFEVEDVDTEYERLTRMNVSIVKPPTTQPWGLRSVWFRDPDGNIVNFYGKIAGEQSAVVS
jgi:predicted enzyme related to lactoylglutathione lyase